jgi:ribosome-associated translation inhibitor RaiA
MADFELQIVARGPVAEAAASYAEEKVRRAAEHTPRPVLFGRVTLGVEANPATPRPAIAKATLDVGGRPVRAHVAAARLEEAIDLLEGRLRRGLDMLSGRRQDARTETGDVEPGEWRHGSVPAERSEYFPRPAEEREVIRHKTYELATLTLDEAGLDMELLGYDFHLFANADTGADSVAYRLPDGRVGLAEAAPVQTLAEAVERLDVTGERFVFYVDADGGRGHLLYRRYDGHYGLVTPA